MFPLNNKTKLAWFAFLLAYLIIVIQPWNLYFLNDDFVHIPLSTQSILVHFQFFRPIPNILTALEVGIFGTGAAGFHLTSIILHIVATVCVGQLCDHLIHKYSDPVKYQNAGYFASLLFLVYPFHSEPVMWIIGRIGIIATIFVVLSMIFYVRRSHRRYFFYLSLVCFVLALFTYETSWVIPLFISALALADYLKTKMHGSREAFLVLTYWVLFAAFLSIRFTLLQQVVTEYELSGHTISGPTLLKNFLRLLGRTLTPPSISTTAFILGFGVVAFILLGYILILISKRSFKFLHALIILFFFIAFLPTTQIGIDTHGSEGERYIYLPSVFWILLLTILLYELPLQVGRPTFVILIVLYSVLFTKSAYNYHHASSVAKKIVSLVGEYRGGGNIVAINLPANYRGALILRSGFKEAIDWIYPQLSYDTVITIPAERSYEKIPSIDVVETTERDGIKRVMTKDNRMHDLPDEAEMIHFNSAKDMLIFFNRTGQGMVLYPKP